MPTIKVSVETKQELENLMVNNLKENISRATPKQKQVLFMQLIQKKYGLTFNDFLKKLIEHYKKGG